jgi:hypothetical protein
MLELLFVGWMILLLVIMGLVTLLISPQLMVEFGLWVLAAGLLLGVPTGIGYHLRLYRSLSRRMALPIGWWRSPVDFHPLLTRQEFRPILPWFLAGAVGFGLCVVGGIVAITGLSMTGFHV